MKEKEREKAFSALRDARGVGVAGVGVACPAWFRDGSRSRRRDVVVLIHSTRGLIG